MIVLWPPSFMAPISTSLYLFMFNEIIEVWCCWILKKSHYILTNIDKNSQPSTDIIFISFNDHVV